MSKVQTVRTSDVIDAALDAVQREREVLLREPVGAVRAWRLADLCRREAELWEQLVDSTSARVLWRAALGARAEALRSAGVWRRRGERLFALESAAELDVLALDGVAA